MIQESEHRLVPFGSGGMSSDARLRASSTWSFGRCAKFSMTVMSASPPPRPCPLPESPCSSPLVDAGGRTPVRIWYKVSTIPASSSTSVILGLALAEVARARSRRVNVLGAMSGEPPDGMRRLLTAWMRSVSTRASRFSEEER